MTFDLSPELSALQAAAREVAARVVGPAAADIDATGTVPPAVTAALASLGLSRAAARDAVVMLEEIAVTSPSAAAITGLDASGQPAGVAGLRGVPVVASPSPRQYLVLAAVCLGIGRAAVAEALSVARGRGDRPAGEPADPPHWVLADAATEVDAARLLVHAAAADIGLPPPAVLVHAAGAATRAVDAALRIVGPAGYRPGSILERGARDARSVWMVLGTEDGVRREAADALLA